SASPAEMPDATVSTTDSVDETVVSANRLAERFSSKCVGAQGSNEILGTAPPRCRSCSAHKERAALLPPLPL
ncbi:hypothetical protein, partial [Mesorhizobium sp. M0870]